MNREPASLSDFTFDLDFSAVRFDSLLYKAQAQTVAVNLVVNYFL